MAARFGGDEGSSCCVLLRLRERVLGGGDMGASREVGGEAREWTREEISFSSCNEKQSESEVLEEAIGGHNQRVDIS